MKVKYKVKDTIRVVIKPSMGFMVQFRKDQAKDPERFDRVLEKLRKMGFDWRAACSDEEIETDYKPDASGLALVWGKERVCIIWSEKKYWDLESYKVVDYEDFMNKHYNIIKVDKDKV